VIIAGTIAVGCIALIAVAFIAPKSKTPLEAETLKTEITTLTDPGFGASTNGFGTSGFGTSGFGTSGGFDGGSTTGINALPPIGGTTSGIPGGNFNTQLRPPDTNPVPIEAAPVATGSKTHVVANGELLGDIALKYYKSSKQWRKIAEANPGIDPKNLKIGQKLVIPGIEVKSAETTPVVAGVGERTYTIKSGDTLYLVAKKELGSASRWKEIEKLNGVSSSDLRVGQVIKLPAAVGGATSVSPDVGGPLVTSGKTHTVAKGENLGDISKQYYGTTKNWKKIVEANPGTSPEGLKVGQKLAIPEIAGSNSGALTDTAPVVGEYVIKAGDTLGSIAQKELGSKNRWKDIQEANPGLDPRSLRAGQKIKIPGKKSTATPAAPENLNPPPASPFGTPLGGPSFGSPGVNSGLARPPSAFGTPLSGQQNSGLQNSGQQNSGLPNSGLPNIGQPTNFPADPTFASPYGGANFGEPAQPFGQTGQGFSQTGVPPANQPSPFGVPPDSALR